MGSKRGLRDTESPPQIKLSQSHWSVGQQLWALDWSAWSLASVRTPQNSEASGTAGVGWTWLCAMLGRTISKKAATAKACMAVRKWVRTDSHASAQGQFPLVKP